MMKKVILIYEYIFNSNAFVDLNLIYFYKFMSTQENIYSKIFIINLLIRTVQENLSQCS